MSEEEDMNIDGGDDSKRDISELIELHKRFPLQNPDIVKLWLRNISREDFQPSEFSVVCSDHFIEKDYLGGVHPRDEVASHVRHQLLVKAVPTIFKAHPLYKQVSRKRHSPPKVRALPEANSVESKPTEAKTLCKDYDHSYFEIQPTPSDYVRELKKTKTTLETTRKELKVVKHKVKRKSEKIGNLLQQLEENNMITGTEIDLYKHELWREHL